MSGQHLPPANLNDFNDDTKKKWSEWMDFVFDVEINPQNYADKVDDKGKWKSTETKLLELDPNSDMSMGTKDDWLARPRPNRFYNNLKDENRPPKPAEQSDFPEWTGFPLTMKWGVYDGKDKKTGEGVRVLMPAAKAWLDPTRGDGNNIWWQADQFRMFQDEYLEWAVVRDKKGKITKITFTCEGPEYWTKLAQYQPDDVVKLYQQFNPDANITKDDLFITDQTTGKSVYNQWNKYNSVNPMNGAIAHLIHPNSTLGAEVDIVAQATIGRPSSDSGDPQTLCACGGFGEKKRASDPQIGFKANQAAAIAGYSISIHEPIGLYMRNFQSDNISPPDDHDDFDVTECWHVIRGDKGDNSAVRVEFYVPEGKGFCVGDLIDNNNGRCNVLYGSQIAQNIIIGVKVDGGKPKDGTPAPAAEDHCNPRDKALKESPPDDFSQYDINTNDFYLFMQYKALTYHLTDAPWSTWMAEYPVLTKSVKADGGHNLEDAPKLRPFRAVKSAGIYR